MLTTTAPVTLTVTATPDVPLIDAGADLTGAREGAAVTFSAHYQEVLRSTALQNRAGGEVTWSFGDGATASAPLSGLSGVLTATHTYADNGLFTVTLTITGSSGLAASDSLLVSVDNLAPTVDAGPGGTVLTGTPFTFHGAFTDPGAADTHTLAWEFGDGQTALGTLTPQHAYTLPGDYTARLTVTDDDGASASAVVSMHVEASIDIGDGGGDWTNPITTTSPCSTTFLGEFGSETVSLDLGQDTPLPAHGRVQVAFDLYIIRSWDGNRTSTASELARLAGLEAAFSAASQGSSPDTIVGPDEWSFKAAGQTLLHTTFSNWDPVRFPWARQAFPGAFPGGDYPSQTGAVTTGGLCYSYLGLPGMDSIYHLTYTFDHAAPTLTLDFTAAGLQEITDESWGLDNVQISLLGGLSIPPQTLYLPVMAR